MTPQADLFRIESRLKGINAFAPILRTEKAQVESKACCGWVKGEVVAHMYCDEFVPLETEAVSTFMPPGMVAPYQVKLDSGELIWAPEDVNNLIRKA
ncbi:hypothetical protein EMIHUDRAFT_450776 [Emiliania huxleyi CCMP1516]|uniref:Uncharacterized protein n=2 Tax=Emiliania huxleyi TaxID=2903 RepID=A0A0D3JDP5_EMIH1|nr:hypothetical protein EMIHUDRAFT_450776 [Emiliania huxleyi CCMP1516]EOD21630.1 hypothetical protein EMIHUDRAFT_450776 [Emiliania huxleyi CCMP1516]|eukprot:XP_005774059.1 hypothetical protein EMIHUDRAFT_450776 [Emiliania huxleyi CCMP1516]